MPGRARGRMFDIRPEDGVEDTGTGAYPGYPGYGDSDIDDFDDYADHYAEQDARRGAPPPSRRYGHGHGARRVSCPRSREWPFLQEATSRRGSTTLSVVPGTTVLFTTTTW